VTLSSNQRPLSVAEADARLAQIVRSMPDAVIGETLDGTVTVWNRAAEELYGYPALEMVGHSAGRLYPVERRADETAVLRRVAGENRPARYVTERIRRDGATITVSVHAAPVLDGAGATTGVATVSWPAGTAVAEAPRLMPGVDSNTRLGHELRTPLNAIIGFTGTLLMRLAGPLTDEQEHQLRLVQSSAEMLLSRINQLSRPLGR
jgi:PAS domain S-box-containing protein